MNAVRKQLSSHRRSPRRKPHACNRRGMSAVEVIAILGVMFPFVMAFYFLGREACVRLFYVIDALVSWPYL